MTIKVVPNATAQNMIANIKKLFFLSRPLKIPNKNHNTKKSTVKMKFKTVGDGPSTNPLVFNIVAKPIVKRANVIFSTILTTPNTSCEICFTNSLRTIQVSNELCSRTLESTKYPLLISYTLGDFKDDFGDLLHYQNSIT